jgi:hypothetical protein
MKIHRNPIEEAFTAKSKKSGKVVNFASQQNRDNAIKSGEYEETDDVGEEPAAAKPKVNIFDKPKPQAQPAADTDGDSKPSSMVAPTVVKTPVDVLKSKVEKWSEKEKAFFRDGIHKEDSPERRNWKDAIKDKAKGALAAIKKGAKHEVEEFKAAGAGVKNFFSGKELSEHEKKALKSVAIKVATTAIFGAVTGGAGHGVLAFGKHVAMEFIPHVVGETILKGAGTAALFAGDEEEDVYMERFMAIIADKMANEKITPELMTQMVDSYNAKKGEGESVNEAAMNPVKKVVNAILKKHNVEAMKTYASSVRGAHNIINGGYRWQGDYFLDFYKVPQDVIEKIGAEMKKVGVKGVEVKKGIIGGDFTKNGLSESVNEETYKVAGRPVVLIKGKNSNGTDWKVKFQNGKETSLSDVIALIKPFPKDIKESELKGYLAADVVDDIVKTIGSKMVKGHVENAPNRNYIYLKLTDIKFGNDVVKMLKSKFGIDAKIDKTFGNIPTISFPSKKVISESVNEEISQLTADQSEMVNGIIEMLLQIKDIDNRMEVAQQQIQNFKDEGIDFNYAGFLSAAGLDNNDEPIRMDTKTMPQHILNKESIMNEEFKHLIHVDTPTQVVSKPVAAQIMALARKGVRSKDIGLEMGFVGNAKLAADTFQKVKNKIYFELGKKFEAVNVKVSGTEQESSEETLESLNNMAMGDLERIEDYAEMISDRMKEGQELSAWMYSQITLAVDQLNSVHDTMDGKDGVKESVITEDTRRAKLLGIDFNISEMNGRIFFSFVDKKAASIQLRQIGTNKIVNHIQNRLDIAYGKGSFFFKSGDHAEFQNGYLFQRSTSDINLNKLKFESVNEAKYIQAKDDWGVRLVQAINNNVHGLHTSVVKEKRDVKESVEAFGTMLKNAIKETLKHKYKPHPKAKDADNKIKTFISELKKFENIVDMVIAKPTKIGVTKLDDAWRSVWNYKYAAEIALAGEVFNSIIEGKVNEVASRTAMEIGALTGTNKDFIQSFVDKHNLDIEKVFQYVKKGKLKDRMDFVTAVVGKDNNPYQVKLIKQFKESVNEVQYPTDLKVGSVIMGQGFTMLKGIEGGKYYKVVVMDDTTATLVPSDKSGNTKGSTKVRHKLDSIEGGIKTAKRGDENGIVVIKESVTEAMGNDKSMLALVDVLSNSMEYYEDESDFLQAVRGGQGWSGIPGFKNSSLIPVFKSIYKKYWTVSPQNRTNWVTKDWMNWLKPFGLEENVNSETDTIEETTLNEKQFKGLEGIPSNKSLEKISKSEKLNIIKAKGNIINFIVPDEYKGKRNFWQVISTGNIKKSSSGNIVMLMGGGPMNSPSFKTIDDLIDGVDWASMERTRRFNESVTKSTPGEQIQNLNNRLTKLRQDMAKAKSPEAKNVIQAKMKNALQKLSDKKKDLGIKKP